MAKYTVAWSVHSALNGHLINLYRLFNDEALLKRWAQKAEHSWMQTVCF